MKLTRRKTTALIGLGLSASLLTACLGGGSDSDGNTGGDGSAGTVDIVGFAVPQAGNDAVIEAFTNTDEGDGVAFNASYGPSGTQSRAVAEGQSADFVHFSIEPDVTRLVDAGLVAEDWNAGPDNGFLTNSVAVLVVRPGNPKNITDWDDLAREGIEIVTPNPGSSGAARWNILGAWQAIYENAGNDEDAALEYIEKFLENVVSFPESGRVATNDFLDGTGDVLISYENEAILIRQDGAEVDYIVPQQNLLIENPAAVTVDASEKAQSFLEFARSAIGQTAYTTKGFRPLAHVADQVEVGTVEGANDPSNPFPEIETLYTIDGTFGGWEAVVEKFFSEDGLITGLIAEAGLS